MGQTSTEAKREVDQTRAHLEETLDALQLKAKRNLDLRTQLQTNRTVQASLAAVGVLIGALVLWSVRRHSKLSATERMVRKLKLNDLRDRLNDFRGDAQAWASAQRRIVKADKQKVVSQEKGSVARRLLISAAEAALTALATGYARRLVSGASTPHERGHAAVSKQR